MPDKVVVLGVNHNDPLGRSKIVALLEDLRNDGFIPDCIATEWDKNIAQSVIAQRKGFINYAKGRTPYLHNDTLEALATAMAYEVDSHITLYPNIPIIWLDKGSKYERPIEYYASDRLAIYIAEINLLNGNDKNNLLLISRTIWRIGFSGIAGDRDIKFYKKINDAMKSGYKNILVIVGARHANIDIKNSFVNRLIKKGLSVQSFILNS